MPQDFSGQNLRGRSFKGQDLTGADFSYTDIHSADFTNAILRGANFHHARAGLQRHWTILLIVVLFLLSALSGTIFGLAGILASGLVQATYTQQYPDAPGQIVFVVFASFFILTIRQGYIAAVVNVAVAVAAVVAVYGSLAGTIDGAGAGSASVAMAIVAIGAVAIAVVVAEAKTGIAIVGVSVTVAVTLVVTGAVTKPENFVGSMAAALVAVRSVEAKTLAGAVAGAVALLGGYVGQRTLAEDEKFASIRRMAIAFAAIGGTSFRAADLTDTDFTQATLKSTDFREATLTRTCWYQAKKLDRARFNDSILAKPSVRDLLVSGNGYKKSYASKNLKGAYLAGANLNEANLEEADISEATLQGANLGGANLTKTQAIGTDFTNAYFTGACLEAWNIDSSTKLEQVDCRFVYLIEHPQPGTDDRERRPSSGEFAPGEFTKLFQEVLNTVDLIFRNGIDLKAFITSFKKLQIDNEGIPLKIQGIEDKGDGVLVVRVSVPPETNKAKIHSEFMQNYELAMKAVEEKYKAELKGKDDQLAIYRQQSADMWLAINKLAEKPVTVEVKATAESKAMSDSSDQSRNIKIGDIQRGDVTGLFLGDNANISGTVANTISQLPSYPQPDKPGIKELLTQLQEAIEADTNLTEEDKAEALEQVKALAEAGKNPQEGTMQKASKTAIKILKGTVAGLPSAATLVEACNKLLPAIASFLGLG